MKCISDRCNMKPELIQSGWHSPHPTYYCPICHESYWEHEIKDNKNNVIETKLRPYPPFKWGVKEKKAYINSGRYDWVR